MSKFRDVAKALLSSLDPVPNPYIEQAVELVGGLDSAAKAQVLAQLAVAEKINRLTNAVKALDSTIALKR
jgi:hypothetical protein